MKIKKKCGETTCARYDTDSILCEYCELNEANLWNQLSKSKNE